MHLFVTGTGTGVGKTRTACQWVRLWRTHGVMAAGIKPIGAGDRDDARLLREASGNVLSLDETNPCALSLPLAPWVAAEREGVTIDFVRIATAIEAARRRFTHLAVEGVGGWLVPLAPRVTVRDWARELGLPVLVVAHAGLGTLNHVLLTLESIDRAGLPVAGVVLNHLSPQPDLAQETNGAALRAWLSPAMPVVEVPHDGELPATGSPWLPLS
jgi:dethiobiotin synthetase